MLTVLDLPGAGEALSQGEIGEGSGGAGEAAFTGTLLEVGLGAVEAAEVGSVRAGLAGEVAGNALQ